MWDRKFRKLTPAAKIVALYIFSAPTRNSEGLFRCPINYMAADTGFSEEQVAEALHELQDAGYTEWDEESETVLDCLALKFNPSATAGTRTATSFPTTASRVPSRTSTGSPTAPCSSDSSNWRDLLARPRCCDLGEVPLLHHQAETSPFQAP